MPMIQAFLSVTSICLTTYVAGVATILGSILIASHLPGSVFVPRKLSCCNDLPRVNYEHFPIYESLTANVDSEVLLPTNSTTLSIICNNSRLDGKDFEKLNVIRCPTWERWSDSTLTSLLDLDFQSESTRNRNKDLEDPSDFSINTEPLQSDLFLQSKDELITIFNRREILDFDSKFPLQNWRYYVSYISLR